MKGMMKANTWLLLFLLEMGGVVQPSDIALDEPLSTMQLPSPEGNFICI